MKKIWTVSEISSSIKETLEAEFFDVSVTGEVSGLKWHSSGHVYFSLIDESSFLNVAFFRRYADRLSFALSEGMRVVASGNISSYPPRSNYQLICRKIVPAGEGDKLVALMNLKRKLKEEGLFEKSRALPEFPERIAVITSPTGAAIEDIKSVLARRFGGITLFLFSSLVEGSDAIDSIKRAINRVKQNIETLNLDLLIIARGGGSKESLDLFNDEKIARLVYSVEIPVVSAIGHQIDETVVDLVADRRVETPSAAAELISPDINVMKAKFDELIGKFKKSVETFVNQKRSSIDNLTSRMSHKSLLNLFDSKSQRADFAIYSLNTTFKALFSEKRERYFTAAGRLEALKARFLDRYRMRIYNLVILLRRAMINYIKLNQLKLSRFMDIIEALSPVATLKRGYSITLKNGRLAKIDEIEKGDEIDTRFYNGSVKSKVLKKDTL